MWRNDSLVLGVKYKDALSERTLSFRAHIHAANTSYMPSTRQALGAQGRGGGGMGAGMH